jgi:hypothetical protein
VLLAAAVVLLLGIAAGAVAVYEFGANRRSDAKQGPGAGAGGPTPLKLLVPAYIYPSAKGLAEWARLLEAPAAAGTVVIVNTSSGPGTQADLNYAKVIDQARHQGVTVIGYVSTKYGDRPLPEAKLDVERWTQFYPGISGIFFDEQASKADKLPYYVNLYEYVRRDQGLPLVITNPGTECSEQYVARPATDVVCLVEANKEFGAYRPPAWTARYPADRFAALLCKTPTAEQMAQVVRDMRAANIGYGYITDADEHNNAWGRLPQYWDAELEAVREANARADWENRR